MECKTAGNIFMKQEQPAGFLEILYVAAKRKVSGMSL